MIAERYRRMFEGKRTPMTDEQIAVELTKYLGIGLRELEESPLWYVETALIRMQEEAEYNDFLARQIKQKHG